MGACPVLSCPLCVHPGAPKGTKAKLLPAKEVLETCADPDISTRYADMVRALLTFQCSGCHKRKSLFVEATVAERHEARENIRDSLSPEMFALFDRCVYQLSVGDISVEESYRILITQCFPDIQSTTDDKIASERFSKALMCVEECERRANLHLRFLRDRPFITTSCCKKNHCFRCKTKEWHASVSCEQNSASFFDGKIVSCPACGINLTRGDGCDTITCVCKHQFGWSAEASLQEQAVRFATTFPEHTHDMCAKILCKEIEGDATSATAWRKRNRVDTNKALLRWLVARHGRCTSQWSAVRNASTANPSDPPILGELQTLWKAAHQKEVGDCERQHTAAENSFFLAMYPDEKSRAEAAYRIIKQRFVAYNSMDRVLNDPLIRKGAEVWASQNSILIDEQQVLADLRSMEQFLVLYGSNEPLIKGSSVIACNSVGAFDPSISDPHLEFSGGGKSAKRPGSVSCYPAALAPLTAPQCMIKFLIESCPQQGNYMSLGLVKRSFRTNGSNGVGPSQDSWGLLDTRDSSSTGPATISACGSNKATWRKFRAGDVVTVEVDLYEVVLFLNASINILYLNYLLL